MNRVGRDAGRAVLVLVAFSVGAVWTGTSSADSPSTPTKTMLGCTFDYEYDGKDIGHPEREWSGRAFLHAKAGADPSEPLPLLVFVHGINTAQIPYRWIGGGNEGDVRRIVSELIEEGLIPPIVLAAPTTVNPVAASVGATSWPAFDLDNFVERTAKALEGKATISRERIIVAGHSGAGCNPSGGLSTAARSKRLHAILAIDTCMEPPLADSLAAVTPSTHVIVSWQSVTWAKRPISDFKTRFREDVAKAPPSGGALRELDPDQPTEPAPHDAMVRRTLRKWLPKLLAPARSR